MSSATSEILVTPAVEAREVTMNFGGLRALDVVDFSAPPGSITGLVGPNGAGKTTLFSVLSGLLSPTSGKVLIAGQEVTDVSPQRRARLGLARTFQRIELFRELSVRDHLVLAHRASRGGSRLLADLVGLGGRARSADEDEIVDGLLDELGLGAVSRRLAASLPLGTGRLVEVGRALAAAPRAVLLDEPSSGLDSAETEALAQVLVRACEQRGVALVLVEHNLELVLDLCARIAVLDFGRIIAEGTPQEVRADRAVQAAYIGTEAR